MVTVEEVKGTKIIDCRVYDLLQDGELKATAAGVSLEPGQVEIVISLLQEAKKKVTEGA